eukprot:c22263_g1_i1 orf=72-326(+)
MQLAILIYASPTTSDSPQPSLQVKENGSLEKESGEGASQKNSDQVSSSFTPLSKPLEPSNWPLKQCSRRYLFVRIFGIKGVNRT